MSHDARQDVISPYTADIYSARPYHPVLLMGENTEVQDWGELPKVIRLN